MRNRPDNRRNKNNVAMEYNQCAICDSKFKTGDLLMDMRYRTIAAENYRVEEAGTLPDKPVTGMGICTKCKDTAGIEPAAYNEYIAMIACDPDKSSIKDNHVDIFEGVYRTGAVGFVRRRVWGEIFNTPIPEEGFCFVQPEVLEHMNELMERSNVH